MAILLAGTTARASAQGEARIVSPCDGRIVHAIEIHSSAPYSAGIAGQWQPVARGLTTLHAVTRPSVVRSFLALHIGHECTELRRSETERILRAQRFLAQVRVLAYDDDSGGVRIAVNTVDEVSLLGGLSVRSAAPHFVAARLGEGNFAGQGIRVEGAWAEGYMLRDRWQGSLTDYAFAGRPYVFTLAGDRDVLGGNWEASLAHPFFTDLQTIGWLAQVGEVRTYVAFPNVADPTTPVALDLVRHFDQVGAVTRLRGGPGHLALFGVSLSDERETPGIHPVVLPDNGGVHPDTNPSLVARYAPLNAFRVNLILGLRDVRFMRVTGFNSLSGEEDLMLGTQAGVVIGRSIVPLGTARDILLSSGFYTATGSHHLFVGLLVRGEARNDLPTSLWDNQLFSGRLAAYWKPTAPQTVVVSTEFGLGLNQRLPFALTFSDPRGGIRGFEGSTVSGGERIVTRVEDRMRLGEFKGIAQFGVAAFTDIGRMWAQGVPYATNSATAMAVGVSLLAAVPIHSKRLWRIDLATPVTHDPNAHFVVRVVSTEGASHFYVEPNDIAVARSRTVPAEIFQYPAQ